MKRDQQTRPAKPKRKRARARWEQRLEMEIPEDELQGRAGEPLPNPRTEPLREWERQPETIEPIKRVHRLAPRREPGVIEVPYERGRGSKFQVEGRGGAGKPRSQRSQSAARSRRRRR